MSTLQRTGAGHRLAELVLLGGMLTLALTLLPGPPPEDRTQAAPMDYRPTTVWSGHRVEYIDARGRFAVARGGILVAKQERRADSLGVLRRRGPGISVVRKPGTGMARYAPLRDAGLFLSAGLSKKGTF